MITPKMKEVLIQVNTELDLVGIANTVVGRNASASTTDTLIKVAVPLVDSFKGNVESYLLQIATGLVDYNWKALIGSVWRGETKLHKVDDLELGVTVSHCVLEYNGQFIDINTQRWVTREYLVETEGYTFKKTYTLPGVLLTYASSLVKRLYVKVFG